LPATLDHLLWACSDLDAAIAALEERSGVRAAYGGRHPELGTHNALAQLSPHAFLEVIAPDPTLRAGALAHRLATIEEPVLLWWAARTDNATATAVRAEAEGYRAAVLDGHRTRPDGQVVRWKNVFLSGHGAGTMVPFFIEWPDGHPAEDATRGLHLVSFAIETPRPEGLRAVFEALDVKAAVHEGARDRLVAVIEGPRGRFELDGAA
jgi:glyoxalase-like protein